MAAVLLGEWGFLDNLDDTSGGGHHGTVSGSPTYVDGPQPSTRGLKFSSETDSVSFGRAGLEPSLEGITVMAWVRMEGTPTVAGTANLFALSKARAATSSRSRMGFGYTTAGNQRQRAGVARWKDALLISDGGPTWTDNNWHHLALVDGNTRYGFYLDGVQDTGASRALGAAANTTWENFPWRAGFNTDLSSDMGAHPAMSISGIRIFQGELTTTEIQTFRDTPIVATEEPEPVAAALGGGGVLGSTAIARATSVVALGGGGVLTSAAAAVPVVGILASYTGVGALHAGAAAVPPVLPPEALPVWVAPSARDLTRTYMLAQLEARGINETWNSSVPAVRPQKFFTIEELNSATEYGVFADAQLIQIRGYSTDLKWLGTTMRLIKGLWKVMPVKFLEQNAEDAYVQNVEHAGGPSFDEDPDVPGLRYGQIISWVTVMTELM